MSGSVIQNAKFEMVLEATGGDGETEVVNFSRVGYVNLTVGERKVHVNVRGVMVQPEIREVVREVYRDPTPDEAVALLIKTVKRSREPFVEAGKLLAAVTNGIVGVVREKEDR